jgi:uncharacterized protein (DUF697 family)/GTP-binding protein EngB required for normal cell division
MIAQRTSTGLLLIVVLAFVGFMLMVVPGQIVEQYDRVRQAGSVWVIVYFSVVGTGAALLLGCSIWILARLWLRTKRKKVRRQQRDKNPSELSLDEQQKELDENLAAVSELQDDEAVAEAIKRELTPLIRDLEEKRKNKSLEIVAFGTISSGKSSVLNALAGRDVFQTDPKGGTTLHRNEIPWPGNDRVLLVDTPGLGEVEGEEHAEVSADAARDADLVLLVVDGPLRDSEFALLQRLANMEKRVLVCLNKQDWYDDQQRAALVGQLADQVQDVIPREDILTVQASPVTRQRVRVTPDGGQAEEEVVEPPDIQHLAQRMMKVIRHDGQDLLLANLLLQSRGLYDDARKRVEAALDQRAWEIVDRYMWGAGGAAALSPLPIVDLAAGGAISIKMVIELARVYRQEIDLEAAVNLVGQLGKNLIGILGVSAATPAVTSAVASLLKTVPGAGTIAGGALQGLVQALITRWIGAVFIVYFKNEMQQPEGGLASVARREWHRVTRADELRKLLKSARKLAAPADEEA